MEGTCTPRDNDSHVLCAAAAAAAACRNELVSPEAVSRSGVHLSGSLPMYVYMRLPGSRWAYAPAVYVLHICCTARYKQERERDSERLKYTRFMHVPTATATHIVVLRNARYRNWRRHLQIVVEQCRLGHVARQLLAVFFVQQQQRGGCARHRRRRRASLALRHISSRRRSSSGSGSGVRLVGGRTTAHQRQAHAHHQQQRDDNEGGGQQADVRVEKVVVVWSGGGVGENC